MANAIFALTGKPVEALPIRLRVVLRGEPASALIDYANNAGVDLIVMGRRGRGRMEGLVIGSVSAKLTSHANCPVLTVK